ncbi:MAG: hypothetical protein N0C90_25610, partial [Candidatus Thiodiazotropha endolucinida]|nr:hypothetical protein [Candidatus Thiodiazotropha taylori]MCW4264726.1 hypothetical protein [Candidatus Thiodiazotropha endolucinida]
VKKKRPRHHSNLHLRNGKRTSKARNNRRRFKNRQIDDLNNMIRQITPTESPKSNRAQHFSAVLNNNMAKGKIRRIFRNETLFVYFDPKSNKTKNVNILDFLQ